MQRRTFLKAIGLGSALIPVITKAASKPSPKSITAKDVTISINGEEITPLENSVNWSAKTPDEIISDLDGMMEQVKYETAHDQYLDNWANLTGIDRKPAMLGSPAETDAELRKRITSKIKHS